MQMKQQYTKSSIALMALLCICIFKWSPL